LKVLLEFASQFNPKYRLGLIGIWWQCIVYYVNIIGQGLAKTSSSPIRAAMLITPSPQSMEIFEGLLLFELIELNHRPQPTKRLLDSFIRLHDAPDTAILTFARRWGCLFICEHGLPHTHRGERSLCSPRVHRGNLFAEPLKIWRSFSAQCNSVLRIARDLEGKRRPSSEDWICANQIFRERQPALTRGDLDPRYFREADLADCINEWLWMSAVRPVFLWDKKSADYQFTFATHTSSPNLFSHLALQLMQEIGSAEFAFCSECKQAYLPERRPDSSRRNYCKPCGRKAAVRNAARRFRERHKGA
jgi:hypothetical protein